MKKITQLLFFVLCSSITSIALYKFYGNFKPTTTVSSIVIESNSIQDIKKFAEPETLFVFDYDNVLIEGKTDYGFDAWFCAIVSELEEHGLSRQMAVQKLLPIYEQIQQSAEVKVVESCAQPLIESLKKTGNKVIILTVRSHCLIDCIFRQLKSVKIDIERGAIPENGINSKLTEFGAKYVNGILMCDGYNKGPALKTFLLGNPNLKVKNIVFIDDKLKNIESVRTAVKELGIKFSGIRYGLTDARVKAYALDNESRLLAQKIVHDLAQINQHEVVVS